MAQTLSAEVIQLLSELPLPLKSLLLAWKSSGIQTSNSYLPENTVLPHYKYQSFKVVWGKITAYSESRETHINTLYGEKSRDLKR